VEENLKILQNLLILIFRDPQELGLSATRLAGFLLSHQNHDKRSSSG
jgi:hypothetical protein